MNERIFTTEVMQSLRDQGAWAYKIPDAPITKEILKITRFTAPKPCDIVASLNGKFIAIECKLSKKAEAFNVNMLRRSQVEHLTNIVKSGGRAFIFLNIRVAPDKSKNIHRMNRLVILDWANWGSRIQKSSIKKDELLSLDYIEGRKGSFDLFTWGIDI